MTTQFRLSVIAAQYRGGVCDGYEGLNCVPTCLFYVPEHLPVITLFRVSLTDALVRLVPGCLAVPGSSVLRESGVMAGQQCLVFCSFFVRVSLVCLTHWKGM